jgi:dimethylglycine dehydrogenase
MWSCDPRRYTNYTDPQYCVDKALEIYGNEYAIHFPKHMWPAARDRKLSAIHDRTKALGGQFGPFNGWERANWYAQPGDDTSEHSTETFSRSGPWQRRVKEECLAVRDHAGILDLPGFSRFKIEGPGTRQWLLGLTTGLVPKPGRIGLAYFADPKGRIVTEMSVMSVDDDEFVLITAAVAQWHDREWLEKHLPKGSEITITDVTEQFSCQILTGPASRGILASVSAADLSKGWLTHQMTEIAGKECRIIRVSFAGELGWELHSRVEDTPAVFDAIWKAGQPFGLRPFGMFALDSLRLEKGYRAWKGDLSTGYTILQGGLDRFVKWEKEDFVGKGALAAEKQAGVSKRFATLTVDAGDYDAPYMSTIWLGDTIVGETTSGGYGHRVGKSIALGMLRSDLHESGTRLEIEIFGQRHAATVHADEPLWDPQNERIRA